MAGGKELGRIAAMELYGCGGGVEVAANRSEVLLFALFFQFLDNHVAFQAADTVNV